MSIIFPIEDPFALYFPIEKKWHFPKIDRKRPDRLFTAKNKLPRVYDICLLLMLNYSISSTQTTVA